ncbi:MAG: TetR/AcrR family transcriptional regulator [Pseudomonadales bacterium]
MIARREDEILAVATGFFARHGYRQTDVQEIADALGIGKGTVYRYFATKEALFFAAVDRGMREHVAAVAAEVQPVADALERMVAAVHAYLRFFDEHPDLLELIIQERAEFKDRKKPTYLIHRDENIGEWRVLIESLIEAGRVRRVPVDRILDVMSYTLYGAIFTNHFASEPRCFDCQADEILDIVFDGILLPAA